MIAALSVLLPSSVSDSGLPVSFPSSAVLASGLEIEPRFGTDMRIQIRARTAMAKTQAETAEMEIQSTSIILQHTRASATFVCKVGQTNRWKKWRRGEINKFIAQEMRRIGKSAQNGCSS